VANVFLVFDLAIVVYYMQICEGSILPSSSSSGVISLQKKKKDPDTDAAFPVLRTRNNNDWNSQESWVSLASKGYLIKLYICLFDAIRQMYIFCS
jgi:hypothetical protein